MLVALLQGRVTALAMLMLLLLLLEMVLMMMMVLLLLQMMVRMMVALADVEQGANRPLCEVLRQYACAEMEIMEQVVWRQGGRCH